MVLLTSNGKPYAQFSGGRRLPDEFINTLKERDERRQLLRKKMKKANENEKKRQQHLHEVMQKVLEWDQEEHYREIMEELVKKDPENKQGYRLTYAAELAKIHHLNQNTDQSKHYRDIVKKIDAERARTLSLEIRLEDIKENQLNNPRAMGSAIDKLEKLLKEDLTKELKQEVLYHLGMAHLYNQSGNDIVVKYMERALEAAPETERADEIQDALNDIGQNR